MTLVEPTLIAASGKAANLANGVNTHLEDNTDSFEAQHQGFKSFALKFERLREILQQIQKGPSQLSRDDVLLPYKESQSLSSKLQLTINDLISSELMVVKLISRSRKIGFGKFM